MKKKFFEKEHIFGENFQSSEKNKLDLNFYSILAIKGVSRNLVFLGEST